MIARRATGTALVAVLAGACGKGADRRAAVAAPPPAGSAAAGSAAAGSAAASAGPTVRAAPRATMGPHGCLHDGRWRLCSLVDRLERSGLVIKAEPDSARYAFLGVAGVRYTVNHGEIQAFVYDDTTRLARDVAALDTVHVSPAGTLRHWDVPPTFIRSGNLAVVLLTANEHLVERVQLAVGGGAPQPDPDAPPVAQPLPPARVP